MYERFLLTAAETCWWWGDKDKARKAINRLIRHVEKKNGVAGSYGKEKEPTYSASPQTDEKGVAQSGPEDNA